MTTKYFLLSIYIILRITVFCQNSSQVPDAGLTTLQNTVKPTAINNDLVNSTTISYVNTTTNAIGSGNTTANNNVAVNSSIINYDLVNSTTIGYAPLNTTANAKAGLNSTTYMVAVNSSIINYDLVNSTTIGYAGINSTTYMVAVNSSIINYDLVNSTTIGYVAVNSTITKYDLVNSTAIGYVTLNSTSIDVVNTTISYSLPGGTDEPARPGEFSSKLRMGCRFSNRKFNNKYKDKTSKEYLDFTNEIFSTMRLNLWRFFRLIMIIFISIDDDNGGLSLNMEFVLASNTSVSSADLSNNVQSATKAAYGDSISILNVNITQEAVAVTPTTTPTTTTATTSTTMAVTTIAYDLPGATDAPARSGEYSSKVRMGCSFTSRKYHSNLKIITSQEYLDFTYEIFFTMRWNLRRFLRLIMILFISLDSGSIVANMELVMASNSSISSDNLKSYVESAAKQAYGNNISITSITVTQESTIVQPIPGWGIFLIILACVIVIVAVVLLTIFGIKYEKSRSKNLEPYLNEPPNDKQGILLKRARMYDSF